MEMNIKPFEKRIWLASPVMHGDELKWIHDAFDKNWITTAGENINEIEKQLSALIGMNYAVALSSGTAALHLAVRLAGEKLYGIPRAGHGALEGHRVFVSDTTFAATVNPVTYEGGEPVLIDSERETWNMDPAALEKAFALYPDVKLIVVVHLYGTPAKIDAIREIADRHGALIVEDAAESLGATYKGRQTASFGDYSVISFNGNKIITGSTGGMLLCNDRDDADKIRKWSTQSREAAPWYEHEEIGYNARISNLVAGVIRGAVPYLQSHIASKAHIFEKYQEGFKDLPVTMNPYDAEHSKPNFWLSCMLIDEEAMCRQVRSGREAVYVHESRKTCPTEILETLAVYNVEGRPIWKPMHMQPVYMNHPFVTAQGSGRARSNAYIAENGCVDVGADIFNRGLCLPSDINMTDEQQDSIIQIIRNCFA